MKNFKKISEVCEELNVSRQTIYRWAKKGLIKTEKSPSGAIFVEVASYQQFKKYTNEIGDEGQ